MAKKPVVKEAAVERELFDRVLDLGGACVKVRAIGHRGFFDRIIILPGGRVIFVEVKRPRGGKWGPHQRQYADLFLVLGAEVALVKKSEDIDALLKK